MMWHVKKLSRFLIILCWCTFCCLRWWEIKKDQKPGYYCECVYCLGVNSLSVNVHNTTYKTKLKTKWKQSQSHHISSQVIYKVTSNFSQVIKTVTQGGSSHSHNDSRNPRVWNRPVVITTVLGILLYYSYTSHYTSSNELFSQQMF